MPSSFIVSRSHPGDVVAELEKKFASAEIIKAGGSGYKSLEVLKTKSVLAYVHTGRIKLWDLCAPAAILKAAGGNLAGLKGEEINFNSDQNALYSKGVLAAIFEFEKLVEANIGG